MIVQLIEKEGKPEWAVVPYDVYQRLLADAEMLEDIRDYDTAKQAIDAGEELIPSDVAYAILDGANPIKVWREYRGITQQALAKQAELSAAYLSQLESGKRQGTTTVLAAIASALHVALDDIVELE